MLKHPRDSSNDNDNDAQGDEYCIKQETHNEDSTASVAKRLAPKTADDDAEEERVKKEEEGEEGGEESGQEEYGYMPSPPLRKRKKGQYKTWLPPTPAWIAKNKKANESKAGLKASPTPSSAGMAKTGRESKAAAGSKASPTPSSAVGTAKGTAWTADEDALLLALKHHTDMSWGDIANAISTHDSKSCQNRLGKLKKDPAATEAAKVAGDSKTWTRAQDTMLKALRAAGMQWKEVASIIPGRDMKSCQNRWSKLKKDGEARE